MIAYNKYVVWLFATVVAAAPAHGARRYVKPTGGGNCSSWVQACGLPTAIDVSASGDEIWVAAGTYASLALKNGVKIIGGFAGTETAASQSNPTSNPTIINGNGGPGNPVQCVTGTNLSETATLRGFIIRNGYLDSYDQSGAGMFLSNSNAHIVECVFEANQATYFGGAVSITDGDQVKFFNCTFRNNGAGTGQSTKPYGGGAVHIVSGNPRFANCLFHHNVAGEGGAILNVSGNPKFTNCTMVENNAGFGSGGGIFDQDGTLAIENSIIWLNTSVQVGSQIFNAPGFTTVVSYTDVQGGYAGTGNINADPQFIDATNGNYDITGTSPCKDVGDNGVLPADVGDLDWDSNTAEKVPWDLGRAGRKLQFTVDMGAYEGPIVQDPG